MMNWFEKGFMDKIAMAGTAKAVRILNKYLPRALETKSLTQIRSGVPELSFKVQKGVPSSHWQSSISSEDIIQGLRELFLQSPVAVGSRINFSVRNSSGGLNKSLSQPLEEVRSNMLLHSVSAAGRTMVANPVAIAGHEGTHAMLSPPGKYNTSTADGLRALKQDNAPRSALERKLNDRANRVLGVAGAQSSYNYGQSVFDAPAEIAADVGGTLFDRYLKSKRPDLHKFMTRHIQNKILPAIDTGVSPANSILIRQPNHILELQAQRKQLSS